MAGVEEYELEIEFEHDETATGRATPETGVGFDVRARAKALAGEAAGRMRAAPLVLLFVASVIGFEAFTGLVSVLVAAVVAPEVFVPGSFAAGGDAAGDPFWSIIMLTVLATLIGLTGALVVFWRRVAGWACLVAFGVWELVRPYVVHELVFSQFDFPPGMVPSYWEGLNAGDWALLTVRFVFLSLLLLPPVLRWVVAKPRASAPASPSGPEVTSEVVTSPRSRPWSVQGARAPVLR